MSLRLRNVLFILVAALLHMATRPYTGPYSEWVHSYGSNLAVSFALFFLLRFLRLPKIEHPLACAGYALLILWAEEFAQMSREWPGVFDVWDLLYDALGVAVAILADKILPVTLPPNAASGSAA